MLDIATQKKWSKLAYLGQMSGLLVSTMTCAGLTHIQCMMKLIGSQRLRNRPQVDVVQGPDVVVIDMGHVDVDAAQGPDDVVIDMGHVDVDVVQGPDLHRQK